MINVYKAFAKRWQNAVRSYALDVWRDRDSDKARSRYDRQAQLFSRDYRNALDRRYREKGINVFRGTIDGKVNDWLEQQAAVQENIRVIAKEKKDKLVADEIRRIESNESAKLQDTVNRLYALKKDENVYKVFSFAEHFEGTADRIGDDEAYGLGRDVNQAVIEENSDRYFWRIQTDSRVRKTHLLLADKCFLFTDPPTTIDKYGNTHTGNPGTDYGCRCFADIAPLRTKARKGYIVREK